jgi:hypothetical protein
MSAVFAQEFYGQLSSGEPLDQAITLGRRALANVHREALAGPRHSEVQLGYWGAPVLFASKLGMDFSVRTETIVPAPVIDTITENLSPESPARRTVKRKRDAGEYDVFLCHNVADKPVIKEIGVKLMNQGILPWLDEWELPPGTPWQRLLEKQIAGIKSAAVFVGRGGIGPWQRQELDGFLREFAQRNCPVIPILLPGTPVQPRLPLFLESMTWVDFRVSNPNPMAQLIWGITGRRPDDI